MLIDEIPNFLASTGIGTVGASIFKGMLPTEAPDQCVVVTEYGGFPSEKTLGSVVKMERVTFQLTVRSNSMPTTGFYTAARSLINSAYRALDGVAITLSGTKYFHIEALQPPSSIGLDENERMRFVCNFLAVKEVSA